MMRDRTPEPFVARQLDLFKTRTGELADRVAAGHLSFIDAVDLAYSAATWSGLADSAGDDAVQAVLASAFMGVRKQRP
jgi:hypothetical protein